MKKLDSSKAEWIIREKRKNAATSNKEIVAKMIVSVRWIQKLHKRYKCAYKSVLCSHGKIQKEFA